MRKHLINEYRRIGMVCTRHLHLKGLRYRRNGVCVGCYFDRLERVRRLNRDAYLKKGRDRARRKSATLKERVLKYYGGRCRKCGISDIDMLTLDHTDNDGASHRQQLARGLKRSKRQVGSTAVYRDIVKRGFPKGFQVLCFNHNIKKHLQESRKKLKKAIANGY